MNKDVRRSVNPLARSQNKALLASCLFSLFVISLAGGVSLGAQTDPAPLNGDVRTQSNGAPGGPSPSQDPKADWWAIDKAVADQLSVNDLAEVIKSLPRETPIGDTVELMRQLNLFVRAGRRPMAAKIIELLPKGDDAWYENNLSGLANFLVDHRELDLARRLFERLPHIRPMGAEGLISSWAQNGDPTEIDRWLVARMEESSDHRLSGRGPSPRFSLKGSWIAGSYDLWFYHLLRFRAHRGADGELLDSLENDIKAHPADSTLAYRYLFAMNAVLKRRDLNWIGDICKPALTFECYLLGTELAPQWPRAAIPLFERALSLPFTDQDGKLLHNLISRLANPSEFLEAEKAWRDWVKLELAKSYQAGAQASKAQPIIEELAAAYPDGLPNLSLSKLAGYAQDASGVRVIESRIEKAEIKNTDSVEYWRARAEYYVGRNERAKAIEAYERALALAPFDINRLNSYGPRLEILISYAYFLGGPTSSPEAKQMLWDEFKKTPLNTYHAQRMVRAMTADREYTVFFGADQSPLWDFLAAQREWGDTESDLLEKMSRRCGPAELEALWDRAEKLVSGGSPTRVFILARLIWLRKAYLRAIPLLKDAINRLATDLEKSIATTDLYLAYINTNNWKAAEEMWPSFPRETRRESSPHALGEIAVAAAKAQALDDAMRFWRAKANLDMGDFEYLSDLARLGLKERLRSFYQQLLKADPDSSAPNAALQLLQ